MTTVFDTYIPGRSLLHRLDPRAKIWAMLLCLALTFLLPGLTAQALVLMVVHILLLRSGIPGAVLGRLWRQLAVLLLLVLILQPFFTPSGRLLVALGPLRLTVGGIAHAAALVLRAANLAFITCTLLFTTSQPALVQGLMRLGLPYTWGLTVSLALRFLPAIGDLFNKVRDAQAARGWVAEGNLIKRFRETIPILVAVLIGTLRMTDQLTLALAARGIESTRPRSTWRELRMTGQDWWFVVGVTVGVAALVVSIALSPSVIPNG